MVPLDRMFPFQRSNRLLIPFTYSGVPTELVDAKVAGVKEAVAELKELGTSEPVIKVNVAITESGFAGIQDAFVYVDPKKEDDTLAGKPQLIYTHFVLQLVHTCNREDKGFLRWCCKRRVNRSRVEHGCRRSRGNGICVKCVCVSNTEQEDGQKWQRSEYYCT